MGVAPPATPYCSEACASAAGWTQSRLTERYLDIADKREVCAPWERADYDRQLAELRDAIDKAPRY